MFGITLLSSGIATINQYMERDLDGLMRRTANRPLPSGKLLPWEALAFGAGTDRSGRNLSAVLVNPLTALLGLTVIAGYLFGLHAAENENFAVDNGRGISRRRAAADWLGRRTRRLSLEAWVLVCDSVSLAVSTFPRDRLDVSRRLRSRRNSHAAGGGARRPRDCATNRGLYGDAVAG